MHFQPVENTGVEAYHTRSGADMQPEASNDPLDDVFGGDDVGATAAHTLSHPSDMRRLESEHSTAGYREGIAVGKQETLQEGFDEGYSMGAVLGLQAGQILGVLEGISQARRSEGQADEEIDKMLSDARDDLGIERLFSGDYWKPSGLPGYEVDKALLSRKEGAFAHPLIQKWTTVLEQQLQKWEIDPSVLDGSQGSHQPEKSHEDKHEHDGQPPATLDPLDW